ncbi:ABC transporter permease [Anaerosporobacter sp.]|uniref:ABC transporter permease n=1 Tax=Anaerosporobacter sp. TaxID=1872529 RepID=UPI002F41CFEE
MLSTLSEARDSNDLESFKRFIESDETNIKDYVSAIQYGYNLDLHVYSTDTSDGVLQLNPSEVMSSMSFGGGSQSSSAMSMMSSDVFEEMLGNRELLESQYDVLAGRFPDEFAKNEVVIVVDENNEISDASLYSIGLMDPDEFSNTLEAVMAGEKVTVPEQAEFTYDEILGTTFKVVLNSDYFQYNEADGVWEDMRDNKSYMKELVNNGMELKVVGILRPNEDASAAAIGGTVAYTSALTEYIIEEINKSDIVKAQLANPETDVFTNMPFNLDEYIEELSMDDVNEFIATLPEEEQAQLQGMLAAMTEEEIIAAFKDNLTADANEKATYDGNLSTLGVVDLNQPSSINIYPIDFKAKDSITTIIEDYNSTQTDDGHEEMTITYTDIVGLMMSSVTTIINMISYILIGFVAISLVVSSIMIGIITYISVLERTKEIGVLRSIGASKRNISSIFNAETLIVGFISGLIGIGVTLLLMIPANAIIEAISGVSGIAALPTTAAVVLIIISMFLTFIAGLIPSKKAAKKDPVTALRSE